MATRRDAAELWFEMTGHTPKTDDEKWAAWLMASLQDVNMFVTWEVRERGAGPSATTDGKGPGMLPVPASRLRRGK